MAQGIKFEEGLSWEQVKQKAKTENKFIFVDCYATWCAPCKMMDKYVYQNDTVGEFVKDKFIYVISIKHDIYMYKIVHMVDKRDEKILNFLLEKY